MHLITPALVAAATQDRLRVAATAQSRRLAAEKRAQRRAARPTGDHTRRAAVPA
jgi:hypothetical protein